MREAGNTKGRTVLLLMAALMIVATGGIALGAADEAVSLSEVEPLFDPSLISIDWEYSPISVVTAEPVGANGGDIIYVKFDAAGLGNGTSWTNAFTTIGQALTSATAEDEIWVAEGIYNEGFFLKGNVALYGGFAGVETARSQRNPANNTTTIDGSGFRHVMVASGISGCVVDGFVITGGSATLPNPDDRGGGILVFDSSIQISNNIVVDNTAANAGGGIYFEGVGTMILEGNVIGNNTAESGLEGVGGGIAIVSGSPVIQKNNISGNYARNDGGGVYIQAGNPSLYNNVVAGNYAESLGGGIYMQPIRTAQPEVINNTIAYNRGYEGTDRGGGIYFGLNAQPIVKNNIIIGNDRGGIVEPQQATSALVTYNDLYDNASANYVLMGAAYNSEIDINNLPHTLHNIVVDPLFKGGPTGNSTTVAPTVLTDVTGSFSPGALRGDFLNPNLTQTAMFYIIDNTDTEIIVAGGDMGLIAASGNAYRVYDFHLQNIPDGDPAASPCIDKGDPLSNFSAEPEENGNRVNQGAYGGTSEAARTDIFIVPQGSIRILPMPDVYIGDLEDEGAVTASLSFSSLPTPDAAYVENLIVTQTGPQTLDLNLFRFPNAFNFDDYIEFIDVPPQTADLRLASLEPGFDGDVIPVGADPRAPLVKWSYLEFADLNGMPASTPAAADHIEINSLTQLDDIINLYDPDAVGKNLRGVSSFASFRDILASPHSLDPGPYTTNTATRWITFFASYEGTSTDSETILVKSIDDSYDHLVEPLFPPPTPDSDWTWTDLALASNLFKAANSYRTNPSYSGGWVLGLESTDDSNAGDGISPGSYVYGTWFSPATVDYISGKLLVARWHVVTDQAVPFRVPAFRFRFETPNHWSTTSSKLFQPSTSGGAFPTAPSFSFSSPTEYRHYWYPPQYIMDMLYTNPAYAPKRGIGLAIDLMDMLPEQVGRIDVLQVAMQHENVPSGSQEYYSGPPFNADDWGGLVMGPGASGYLATSTFGISFSPTNISEFRAFIWSLEPGAQAPALPNTLYRAVIKVVSTNDPLPPLRLRLSTATFDNVVDNMIYVDNTLGGKVLNGLSVPGSIERTIEAYLWVPTAVPGDKVFIGIDAYEGFGFAKGTYSIKSCKLERVFNP